MFHYHYDPLILSSVCPYSCAVVAFAARLGGTIDPEFLEQCRIMDPKFQKSIDALKPIPLDFQSSTMNIGYQEDIFLDMAVDDTQQFYDSWGFKQHNSWLGSQDQWNSTYADNHDILIDFL
jgi:hypothetical protein